ncbi:hypothetical protein B0H11DRAFT_1900176 [Mycena galericulata]|nr:hypothetical protein B0H11DRAFT_1900176 [Mycena galericulata]
MTHNNLTCVFPDRAGEFKPKIRWFAGTFQVLAQNGFVYNISILEKIRRRDSALFKSKLKGAIMELADVIDRSIIKIMNRMESGPHDSIDEPDIKEIWKALNAVLSSTFMKSTGEDTWTLKILSKVINYPAVGEAIDEDASGFVSVHEINHFLKRNKELSTPVWFAFYTDKIDDIMEDLEERCRKLKTDDPDLDIGLEELDDEAEQDLVEVAKALAKQKEDLIEANLNVVGYRVDQSSLPSLVDQAAFRIEQEMDETLDALVWEFHQRFKSLRRSWRSQKLDIELQVQCYAGGLFNGWYKEAGQTSVPESEDDEEDSEDTVEVDSTTTSPAISVDTKVDQLSQRVTALDDARLDTIESMLRQIMNVSSREEHGVTSSSVGDKTQPQEENDGGTVYRVSSAENVGDAGNKVEGGRGGGNPDEDPENAEQNPEDRGEYGGDEGDIGNEAEDDQFRGNPEEDEDSGEQNPEDQDWN